MSVTKELIEQEVQLVQTGHVRDLHLHKEGTFLRAYNWSAWLACRYLHNFKANKRAFKGIDEPVAYIGFPETSLTKWLPEGACPSGEYLRSRLNSMLGLLSHYCSYHVRREMFFALSLAWHYGYYARGMMKYMLCLKL